MARNALALLALAAVGTVLGVIALRAGEQSYSAPERPAARFIPVVLADEVPPGSSVRTLAVEGICCQGCSGKLYGALLALEGVSSAAVDPTTETAMAIVSDEVSDASLEDALTFDKYRAVVRNLVHRHTPQ